MKSVCRSLLSSGHPLCRFVRWHLTLSGAYLRDAGDRSRNKVGKFRTTDTLGSFSVQLMVISCVETLRTSAVLLLVVVWGTWRVGCPPSSRLVQNSDPVCKSVIFLSGACSTAHAGETRDVLWVCRREFFMPVSSDQRENFSTQLFSNNEFLTKIPQTWFCPYLYIWKEKMDL